MSAAELLVYSWNTQASFFDANASHILQDIDARLTNQVQLIVIALQEAVKPGSHFMSLILPSHLATQGFTQLYRSRLMGIGVTTYKALQRLDLRLRGLRLAVYARASFIEDDKPSVKENYCYCSGIYRLSFGKGALSFVIDLPRSLGKLRIVNLHLPFDASTLNSQDPEVRKASVRWQTKALCDIWDAMVEPDDTFVIMVGDFNYRVCLGPGETVDDLDYSDHHRVYRERDEFLSELNDPFSLLPRLQEGVDNAGPAHGPTAKLIRGSADQFNVGKLNRRAPSWCDRIFFAQHSRLACLAYDRCVQNPATLDSDHAAITARFRIGLEK